MCEKVEGCEFWDGDKYLRDVRETGLFVSSCLLRGHTSGLQAISQRDSRGHATNKQRKKEREVGGDMEKSGSAAG